MSDSLDTSPLADAVLTQELLDLIHQASQRRKARKGLNEVTKAVARGDTNVVILAADVNPIAIVLHLPGECERKDIPYIFVASQRDLARACGMGRPTAGCSVTIDQAGKLAGQTLDIVAKIERLLI